MISTTESDKSAIVAEIEENLSVDGVGTHQVRRSLPTYPSLLSVLMDLIYMGLVENWKLSRKELRQ